MKTTKKQQDLINYMISHKEQGFGSVNVSQVAIELGSSPQAIGRMANKIEGMGTHPNYQDKNETCIYYVN